MNESPRTSIRAKRIGLYLAGVALVAIGVGAFGVVAFAAAWDSAWGTSTGLHETGPFMFGGLGSWTAAFFAIQKGRRLRANDHLDQGS